MKIEKNIILIMVILLVIMQNIIGEIKKGEEAPLFSLPDVSNQYIALRDLCGEKLRKPWKNKVKHVVVLSFFASWCKPCIAELPHLQKIQNQFKDQPVKFFLINVGEDKIKIEEFKKSHNPSIPILMDKYKKVSEKYDALRLPRLIVIDKQGIIQLEQRGFTDGKMFESQLNSVISKLLDS